MAASSSGGGNVKDEVDAFVKLRAFGQCSLVASKRDRNHIAKMACIVQDLLYRTADELVEMAGDKPLLQVYSADGTPVSLRKRVNVRLKGTVLASTVT